VQFLRPEFGRIGEADEIPPGVEAGEIGDDIGLGDQQPVALLITLVEPLADKPEFGLGIIDIEETGARGRKEPETEKKGHSHNGNGFGRPRRRPAFRPVIDRQGNQGEDHPDHAGLILRIGKARGQHQSEGDAGRSGRSEGRQQGPFADPADEAALPEPAPRRLEERKEAGEDEEQCRP